MDETAGSAVPPGKTAPAVAGYPQSHVRDRGGRAGSE
jgi:hypothetical protein